MTQFLKTPFAVGSLLCSALVFNPAMAAEAPGDAKAMKALSSQWNLLDQYCVKCHNSEDWAGSLDFTGMALDSVGHDAKVWETVTRKLRGRLMPPPGNERPDEKALDGFVLSMENYLDTVAQTQNLNPGHIAVHRLNRKEYQNAIEDILSVQIDAEDLLPADTSSNGFDNLANVLQVSPSFFEQYMQAARAISILALGDPNPAPDVSTYAAPSLATQYRHIEGLPLGTRGGFTVEHYFPAEGEYQFNVELASQEGSLQRSYPTWWLESQHRFILTIDGEEVYSNSLGGFKDAEAVDLVQTPAITEIQDRFNNIKVTVPAGHHTIGAAFIAKSFAESDRMVDHLSPGEGQDNIPVVVQVKAFGPLKTAGEKPQLASRDKIFSCYPSNSTEQKACATQIMSRLARQAFRRPINDSDLQALMQFYDNGVEQGGFENGMQKAIMAMLGSTKFLYRAEPLPEGAKPGEAYPITDLELASRLSYFLWSRSPDEELLRLAEQGKLRDKQVLQQQVRRMLADPRSTSMVENFAFQWLRVEDIDAVTPDPRIFPDFDEDLRIAMKEELTQFVDSILRSDRSVVELLTAKHSFINERLARHYDIADVRGSQFRQVTLADGNRHGLLGKAGVLMLTSYPNRTSPVLRGSYVLDVLVGTPPAAPPPGVETNIDTQPGEQPKTVRLRLEAHRSQPSCNQCHGVIDPMGLGLENFDAIGKWRTVDRFALGSPIDAQGNLVTGQPITGPGDVRQALANRPEQFVWGLTEKLMIFALGRATEYYDMPVVRSIVRDAASKGNRFESLVLGIVESPAFQMKSLPTTSESAVSVAQASNND